MTGSARASVWAGVLGTLAVALVLLVVAVLPAEFGVDPTGFGRATGLAGLAAPPPRALRAQDQALSTDRIEFELLPYESLEYKYLLPAGAAVLYAWRADGPLIYDFHSEPAGAAAGTAESFDAGRGGAARGAYVAPFAGEHGWFWENRGAEPVRLILESSGFFTGATEYRDGVINRRAVGVR